MPTKQFPYKAFRLTPSMQVKEVMVTGSPNYKDWLYVGEKHVWVLRCRLFETAAAAHADGAERLAVQRARHEKVGQNIERRAANLAKSA